MTVDLPNPKTIGSTVEWVEANSKLARAVEALDALWLKQTPGSSEWQSTQKALESATQCWSDVKAVRFSLLNQEIKQASTVAELKSWSDKLKTAADAVIEATKYVNLAVEVVNRMTTLVAQVNGLLSVFARLSAL
jgi:hypothetical protein